MALERLTSAVVAGLTLVACGGMTTPTSEEIGSQGGNAAAIPDTIPSGPSRPAGAVGTKPCSPLTQPTTVESVSLTNPVLVGRSWNHTIHVIDEDPSRPGRHRAFIARGGVLERHALSEDPSTPDRFIIDRGLPNQIVLTRTTIQGAGADGPFVDALPEQLATVTRFANDAPASLAYATYRQPNEGPKLLFVLGPSKGGALEVPRVFYGPSDAIEERTFLGFSPSDSSATATPATAVTFDVGGEPTTLPTLVTRQMQGLINGFPTGNLKFLCF